MTDYQTILYEVRDGVARLTINNPMARNPVNNETKRELMDAFERCDADDAVRAVVIRGSGGVFSAGGDLKAMKARIDEGQQGSHISCRLGGQMNQRLRNLKKPTIALVEGAAAGSGICLALSCDFQIVQEDAKLRLAFVNIGYVPDSGATMLVAKAVGTVRATDLLMSGRIFTGREAAGWGLFTEAAPARELETRLEEYLEKYANGPTLAYGKIKTLINRVQYAEFFALVESEIEFQRECEQTRDYREAVQAFFQKRPPEFLGK